MVLISLRARGYWLGVGDEGAGLQASAIPVTRLPASGIPEVEPGPLSLTVIEGFPAALGWVEGSIFLRVMVRNPVRPAIPLPDLGCLPVFPEGLRSSSDRQEAFGTLEARELPEDGAGLSGPDCTRLE